jgi:hypothetical protein
LVGFPESFEGEAIACALAITSEVVGAIAGNRAIFPCMAVAQLFGYEFMSVHPVEGIGEMGEMGESFSEVPVFPESGLSLSHRNCNGIVN